MHAFARSIDEFVVKVLQVDVPTCLSCIKSLCGLKVLQVFMICEYFKVRSDEEVSPLFECAYDGE